MKIYKNKYLLKIYLNEQKQINSKLLYEQIVLKAKELDMAGATVSKGIMSFGKKGHLHTTKILNLSEDLPINIEIIDTKGKIDNLLKTLDNILTETLISIQKIEELRWYPNN